MKTITGKGIELRLPVMFYTHLIHYVFDYGLRILSLSHSQCERVGWVQNDGVATFLECPRITPIMKLRCMVGWYSVRSRLLPSKVKTYMDVIRAVRHPLNRNIDGTKGTRIK